MASFSLIDAYLSELPPHVVLTREEQRELIVVAQRGRRLMRSTSTCPGVPRDIDAGRSATDRLLGAHLRLMINLAKELAAANESYVSLEDLISAGHEGLLEALDRFDVAKDNLFWTFAVAWVRNRMSKQIRTSRWLIPIPETDFKDFLRILATRRRLADSLRKVPSDTHLANVPSDEDIARDLGWAVERVTRTMYRCTYLQRVDSLDRTIPGTDIPLGHTIASTERRDRDEVADEVVASVLRERVSSILIERLSPVELTVISSRHATLDHPTSYRSLAIKLGVSAERVRQIERIATRKLASSGLARYFNEEGAVHDDDDDADGEDLSALGAALLEALREAGEDPADVIRNVNSV